MDGEMTAREAEGIIAQGFAGYMRRATAAQGYTQAGAEARYRQAERVAALRKDNGQ